MADREKVIKGLECCLSGPMQCGKCPYKTDVDTSIPHCVRDLRENAIELLKAQEVPGTNVGKWISVKERLPKVGNVVLAFGTRSATTGQFQGISNKNDLWWWKGHTIKRVTHWMPLPEPPKEET